jgi:hypothetical protein
MLWVIDSDSRMGGDRSTYHQRVYACKACSRHDSGYAVIQQGPEEFLFQPDDHHPMTLQDFEHWARILKENFPDHPRVRELGRSFVPCLPEDSYHARPFVLEMRDRRGRRRTRPQLSEAAEWLAKLGWMNTLTFQNKDGWTLRVKRSKARGIEATCSNRQGHAIAVGPSLTSEEMLAALEKFFAGDMERCLWAIAPGDHTVPEA